MLIKFARIDYKVLPTTNDYQSSQQIVKNQYIIATNDYQLVNHLNK